MAKAIEKHIERAKVHDIEREKINFEKNDRDKLCDRFADHK